MMVISALKQVATAATNAVHSATGAGNSHANTSGTSFQLNRHYVCAFQIGSRLSLRVYAGSL